MIVREVLVSVAVLVLASMGARRIDVQWVGKAGTLALMVAFPLFLVGNSPDAWWKGAARSSMGFRHPRADPELVRGRHLRPAGQACPCRGSGRF